MRVLVTDAGGFVGGRLVPALSAAGHEVTALVGDADGYPAPDDVRVLEGDLLEPDACRLVRRGHATAAQPLDRLLAALDLDAAYYLADWPGSADPDARDDERRAAEHFASAADAGDVARVVRLGDLGPGGSDGSAGGAADERSVGDVLAAGSPTVTTLRAPPIVGRGGVAIDLLAGLAGGSPLKLTPSWVRTECQPIAVEDAVAYLAGALEAPETAGETYEIGGPDVLTVGEMLRRTRRALGGRLYAFPVPVRAGGLSARWVRRATGLDTGVARALVRQLSAPNVVTDDAIREHVAVEPTPFDEAMRRALGAEAVDEVDDAVGDVEAPA